MKEILRSISIILLFSVLLFSCETDFDTITNYEDITVVYGILDQTSQEQYIKINKAFLSETNVLTYANNPDSNQYLFEMEVFLEDYDASGNLVNTYPFDTTSKFVKEPGQFYSDGQVIYEWKGPDNPVKVEYIYLGDQIADSIPKWLNDDHIYRLKIRNPRTGKTIGAQTNLVKDFKITKPNIGKKIGFLENPVNPKTFSWDETENAGKYEFELRFNFDEIWQDSVIKHRYLILSKATVNSSSNNSEVVQFYWDDNFYSSCENQIPYSDPAIENQVIERRTGLIEVFVKAAENNLALYMDVNAPSTSIIQEKPQYSNIENGIGIFSSRYYKYKIRELDDQTVFILQNYAEPDLKFKL